MTTAQLDAARRGGVAHVLPLPPDPKAVSAVRRRVRTVLVEWRLAADAVEDVLLVVSELITNALVHALPPATLSLSRTGPGGCGVVRVEVTDMGPAALAGAPASALDPDECGRGLDIVTALATRCGVDVRRGGTGRWAELDCGQA